MLKIYKFLLIFSMFKVSYCCRGTVFEIIDSKLDKSSTFKYTWLVLILNGTEDWGISYGSLIHTRAVLAAAVDIEGHHARHLSVKTNCELLDSMVYGNCANEKVSKVIYPDDYDGHATLEKFYALLILQTPFEVTPTIAPIALGSSMEVVQGDTCIVLHWLRRYKKETNEYDIVPEAFLLPYVNGQLDAESMDTNQLEQSRDYVIKSDFSHDTAIYEERLPLHFSGSSISCCLLNDTSLPVMVGIATFGLKIDTKNNYPIESVGSAFLITDYYDEIMRKVKENVISEK